MLGSSRASSGGEKGGPSPVSTARRTPRPFRLACSRIRRLLRRYPSLERREVELLAKLPKRRAQRILRRLIDGGAVRAAPGRCRPVYSSTEVPLPGAGSRQPPLQLIDMVLGRRSGRQDLILTSQTIDSALTILFQEWGAGPGEDPG
jgi:hypothetical protein